MQHLLCVLLRVFLSVTFSMVDSISPDNCIEIILSELDILCVK